jgi:hypothetical protein
MTTAQQNENCNFEEIFSNKLCRNFATPTTTTSSSTSSTGGAPTKLQF